MIDITTEAPALTRKEALWFGCRQKRCCYEAVVVPTGRDIWRISRRLGVPPWSFLVYFRAPQPRRDAFALDAAGPVYRLALAKRPSRRTKTPAPCIFLLRTRTGVHRCALAEHRPIVCRSFPVELIGGVACFQLNGGCTCRTWSLADADLDEELALLAGREAEAAEYVGVVAAWNEGVAGAPDGAGFTFFDFCAYLLDAYDRLAAAGPTGGEP